MELVSPGFGLIFWMLVSFSILLFITFKFIWPAILGGLKEREEEIASSLEEAKKAREEMKALQSDNQALIKEAKNQRDEILKEAKALKDDILKEAKQQATLEGQQLVEESRKRIQQEKVAAITELKNEVADLSISIAEKLIKTELSADTKKKDLMDKLIKEADKQLN
ncbi:MULTISPECIES: F0F1 ATP synthase subunit B [unclassified Lentimicrobium]|uniref:F0F1 ATP synthase subunit B n=1 Tax=unclassified Lentimicrobium TaxID=2677434 RepID=UPI001551CD23|nr:MULTISPECIES: F0F1 ATP synthase subunit B [unclassified Lentimicrobium]NPD46452.1 F0F1 ATP synthase subunit B [Lentimicrobium sp. S6]NPD84907.1 F0F1 ATP synthase subunit B [Lentimicrobium sp. L6]